MKNSYTATFKNGKVISRNTHKEYTHAYFVPSVQIWDKELSEIKADLNAKGYTGFASSRELAEKAARQCLFPTQQRRGRGTAAEWYRRDWAKNKERYAAGNAAKITHIEIVEVHIKGK